MGSDGPVLAVVKAVVRQNVVIADPVLDVAVQAVRFLD
jgi:hypothetical protein